MPLGFATINQGIVPFGFFNTEADMILLNNYFTFASDFCDWLIDWASADPVPEITKQMYVIDDYRKIGNLGLAIHGVDHSGLIGESYAVWPFPKRQEDFKQQPEGWQNRAEAEAMMQKYAEKRDVPIVFSQQDQTIRIGDYLFDKPGFHELVDYIWRGGMPQWRDEIRPQYVLDMMDAVKRSTFWLFDYGA